VKVPAITLNDYEPVTPEKRPTSYDTFWFEIHYGTPNTPLPKAIISGRYSLN